MTIDGIGPLHDRRWMLVNEDGLFQTQRKLPKLAQVKVAIQQNFLHISHPSSGAIELAIKDCEQGPPINVQVWQDSLTARQCSPQANEWFSDYCGKKLKLVYLSPKAPRVRHNNRDYQMGFADSRPFLLTATASLEFINQQLGTNFPMSRFRPNIIVETSKPFIEEAWEKLSIGEINFDEAISCQRCIVINIDQTKGIKTGAEPLKSLRKIHPGGKLDFGRRMVHSNNGVIKLGDVIKV